MIRWLVEWAERRRKLASVPADPQAELRARLEGEAAVLNGMMIDEVPAECPECDSSVSFGREVACYGAFRVVFFPCRHDRPASLVLVDKLMAERSIRHRQSKGQW